MQNKKITYYRLTIHERINAKQSYETNICYGKNVIGTYTISLCWANDIREHLNIVDVLFPIKYHTWTVRGRNTRLATNVFFKEVYKRKVDIKMFCICTSSKTHYKLFGKEAKQQREIDNFLELF